MTVALTALTVLLGWLYTVLWSRRVVTVRIRSHASPETVRILFTAGE